MTLAVDTDPAITGGTETDGTTDTANQNNDSNNNTNTDAEGQDDDGKSNADFATDNCKKSMSSLGWIVCPVMQKISEAVDWLYDKIEGILVISPIKAEDGSPIYEIWKYCLSVTNIIFIIFLLVVIYSQITGWGINNYGIKKALPKLIVMAIMVNLSFLICSFLIDVSNIIGNGLRGIFESVEQTALSNMAGSQATIASSAVSMADAYTSMAAGTALAIGAGALLIAFEPGVIWMMIPTLLGAVVAVATGLVTIALRQAVVILLVMIAPLAFVANILPNTEGLFQKWKKLLERMLVFYPMFSLLFGASQLAGFAIIMSAKDGFMLLLGMAVQIFPLFFSWKLMQMSGTLLGDINAKLRALTAKPLAASRSFAEGQREMAKQKRLAAEHPIRPSTKLMQFMSNRKIAKAEEMNEMAETVKLRGQAYAARRNYKKGTDIPSKEGEEAYARQARNMDYMRAVERHKNNMTRGFGMLNDVKLNASSAQKARINKLDLANVTAADNLKIERARGEKIDYENARGFHNRMERAVNTHFDDANEGKEGYKQHDMTPEDRALARAQYSSMHNIMEGDVQGIHYAAAAAAQGFDTQKKVVESKMQKYFELTPPTNDVEMRLKELTILNQSELDKGRRAADNIDSIIAGFRVLNQRGDTDILKRQVDNILDANIGGGVELGTHASQSLASFLMFEAKDSDPFLRRFGKYINLETAKVYNKGERKVMDVTYDEYIRGYHDGEPDTPATPGGRMYAKKAMRQLMEGTSLDNIERTALSNLDESLMKAYGYKKIKNDDGTVTIPKWDVDGWLKKREEIQTAFEPAFLSASLKWLSGSEQINSGVKFWTGYELKQRKDEKGNIIKDEDQNPVYDLSPVWEDEAFQDPKARKKVEDYFRRKTNDYFKDQTTGQILAMRTDYRDATMEHLLESYLLDDTDEEAPDEKRRKYDEARAEIQTRYADEKPEAAKKKRDKDLKKLKMELAGKQVRKILGDTGKLEQIYRTRRSGAANNAKDWLRGWIGLDDEEAMYEEVKFYERKRRQQKEESTPSDADGDEGGATRVYDADFRNNIRNSLEKIWEDNRDVSADDFYDLATEWLVDWFGEGETVIGKEFEEYYKQKKRSGTPEAYDLKKELEDLLHDPSKYPDA